MHGMVLSQKTSGARRSALLGFGNNTGTWNGANEPKGAHIKRALPYLTENASLVLILNHFALSISGPEKAGVGGSVPFLATLVFSNLQVLQNAVPFHFISNFVWSVELASSEWLRLEVRSFSAIVS
jgi:hypothetical protein